MDYTVYYEYFRDDDAEGYNVVFPAIPEIITWGQTLEDAEANAKEALACHLKGLEKDGEHFPKDIDVESPLLLRKIRV